MSESSDSAPTNWAYTEREVILYALSIGCGWNESRYVYENDPEFCSLPTFAVLPLHRGALEQIDVSKLVPNFNPAMLLHGEQFLELHKPFPSAATVVTKTEVIDVLDKGRAALVILSTTTHDEATGELLARNEVSTFLRGSGGFGKTSPKARTADATAPNDVPRRPPDMTVREGTHPDQAALYRLNGDWNPLHIDGGFASVAGFERPILHGLCTFGIAAKHVLQAYGAGDPANLKSIKARFAKHVFPGETLRTDMWRVSDDRIIFRVTVEGRGDVAISNAAVVLRKCEPSAVDSKL